MATEYVVRFVTLLKIALAVLLAAVVIKLWPVILMLIVAVLIAVMLDPLVVWLGPHGVGRTFAIVAIACVMFLLLIGFFFLLLPVIGREVAEVSEQLPQLVKRLGISMPDIRPTNAWLARGLAAGKIALQGISAVVFVLVIAIYLLVEGRRAFAWLISFAPPPQRVKILRTADEVRVVIVAYMRGSFTTAVICALYVAAVVTLLGVPLALLLVVMAFVFDFIPIIGTIVMTVPAALLALTVSPGRALVVAAAYILYHVIEAYILIPRIWGRQMRVSTLTVLLAIAIGGTLLGVLGAVLALPIAAAYPSVERIWLRKHLPADTVERHEELEKTERNL